MEILARDLMLNMSTLEIDVIGLPLLFIPLSIGLICLMTLLLYAKTKMKEALILTIILFVLFCLSFQTYHAANVERLIFFSLPYQVGTLITIGVVSSINLLLFTKLRWKPLIPDLLLLLLGVILLSIPVTLAGTILSLFLLSFGIYRLWGAYQSNDFRWMFGSNLLFSLLGLFGFIGLWFPFDGGRFLYTLFLLMILTLVQLQLLDFVMVRLKTASVSSITDNLTGLYNKGFLIKKANQLAATHEISIIFADIDNFKLLNDTKGHEHGDIILKDISKLLHEVIGVNGFACRFGGEELVGIVTRGDAKKKAEKFRALVESRIGSTVSVGVSTGTGEGSVLIKEADIAMYKAKNGGKNRVVIAEETKGKSIEGNEES